jgi:hypothetical protein
MTLLLALLALGQDTVTIPRSGREAYARHVPEAERAAGMVDSDPQGAADLLDPIIDNAQIEKRECRIRWEVAPGTFSRYYDFLPYQARGKAYLKLAEKAADNPDKARGLLEKAVKDFTASKDRGVAASEELLKQAQLRIAGLAKPETTSREFDSEWGKLIDAGKFVEAKALLDSDKGKLLPADRRKAFLDDTNEKCRLFADAAVQRFLRNLRQVSSPRQLEMMTPAGFDRDFSLPDRAALVETGLLPEYLWALSARPVLGDLRQKKDALEALLQIAVQAVPLAAKEYDWFGGPEGLAYEVVRARMAERADDAKGATAGRRKELRAEAEALEARWKKFEADARQAAAGQKKVLDLLPSRSFAALLERFPVDVSVGPETLQALLKTAEAPDPDRALSDVLARLDQLGAGWEKLSVESRRELLQYRIAARALRGLLTGGTPDRVAADLRLEGADYKAAGGTADEARFGPKVQKVFQLLVK